MNIKILFSIALVCFLHNSLTAQLKVTYCLTVGMSRNKLNSKEDRTTPQNFNNRTINELKGYTSPVIGINATLKYKSLYSCIGLEYNKIKTSNYNYTERAFFYPDANEEIQIVRYYDDNSSSTSYSKLNIPIELGFQFLKNYQLRPFVFSGVNVNYILSGKISSTANVQDPFSRHITTTNSDINIFDNNANYNFSGSRFKPQYIIGAGLQFKKNISVKASLRTKSNFFLNGAYFDHFENKEYVISLNYNF